MGGYIAVWRHVFEKDDPISVFKKNKEGSFIFIF